MTARPDTFGSLAGLPPDMLPGRADSLDGLLLADLLRVVRLPGAQLLPLLRVLILMELLLLLLG